MESVAEGMVVKPRVPIGGASVRRGASAGSVVPQLMQKRALVGFGLSQFGQLTIGFRRRAPDGPSRPLGG